MKKILTLGLVSLLLFSCSKDEKSNGLSGTYRLTAFTTDDAVDFNNNGVATKDFITESNCFTNSRIIFTSSDSANIQLESGEVTLQAIGNEDFTYTFNCTAPVPFNATWEKDGSDITFISQNSTQTFSIDGNSISVYFPDYIEYQTFVNGSITSASTGATLVFTK